MVSTTAAVISALMAYTSPMDRFMAIIWLLIWGACALVFGYFTVTVSLQAGVLVALGLLIGAGLIAMVGDIVLGLGGRR